MIDFEIKSRVLTIGNRKGQTGYYAYPKTVQKLTNKMLVERIVRETSLSAGDVSNALISLGNIVCESLQQGMSVDAATGNERGPGRTRLATRHRFIQGDGHPRGRNREGCPENTEDFLHAQAENA